MSLTQLQIEKVKEKIGDCQEKRIERSSELACEIHHSECLLKCCGSHDLNEFGKCKICKMTEEEIDDHNMEWWGIVDNLENGDDRECHLYQQIEFTLEEFLKNA